MGFDARAAGRGSGTQNMIDRVEALGGTLEITSEPGAGTRVRGSLPLPVARTPSHAVATSTQ